MILVTGGAGFIGTNFVLDWIAAEKSPVVNVDKLTYAGNLNNLISLKNNSKHVFVQGDIQDRRLINELLQKYKPAAILNFAAETHVDRSILEPDAFIKTNINGTHALLEEALDYWRALDEKQKAGFRFIHISTDEVYGSIEPDSPSSTEESPFAPNSPYAASKAASDHLVRAYFQTYGLPAIVTHSTNNFGPFQFPEKLIPLMIVNATQGKFLPIYGDGLNIRNWLYVKDHCSALKQILKQGLPGESYNIGGEDELTNKEIVQTLCSIMDELKPSSPYKPHESLIRYVKDRPGHDRRYSIDSTKLRKTLGWKPQGNLISNLRMTVAWYLDNKPWVDNILSGDYLEWIKLNYLERETV